MPGERPGPPAQAGAGRCSFSFNLLPALAADQHFRMAHQVICEHPQSTRRLRDFLQRVAQLLLHRRVGADQRVVGILQQAFGGAKRAPRILQRPLQSGDVERARAR